MTSLQANLLANGAPHITHQRLIKRGSHAQTRRKNGGSNGHVTMRSFLGQENGDAQTGLLHGIALHGIARKGSQSWCKTIQ